MKKLILTLMVCMYAICSTAQNAVYFDMLSETTQLGMGRNDYSIVLAVMQKIKKGNKPLRISFTDQFGTEYASSDEYRLDTVIVYTECDTKYVEYDYRLNPLQLMKLYSKVSANDAVYINGERFSATVFVAVMKDLEQKYNRPEIPRGRFFNMNTFHSMFRKR